MAEEQTNTTTNASDNEPINKRKNSPYSRPVFKQILKVNSLQGQRVMDRSFSRVSNSLFSIDVILRIIGEQAEIDEVEGIITSHIDHVSKDLDEAAERLAKLMSDNGIDAVPSYTQPAEYEIEITSPQIAQFAYLVRKLDNLMGLMDTLWLNTILTSKQRSDATYQWQQRLIKLAARIIGIEKRARISAHGKGKESEVSEAAPESNAEITDTDKNVEAKDEAIDSTETAVGSDASTQTPAPEPTSESVTA